MAILLVMLRLLVKSIFTFSLSVYDPDLRSKGDEYFEARALLKQKVPTCYVQFQKELSKVNFSTKGTDIKSVLYEDEFMDKYGKHFADQEELDNAVSFLTLQGTCQSACLFTIY